MSSFPLSGTEFGEKLKSYAETNIAATNEYVRKLSEAKDLQEVVRIQTEFVQQQFNAFGEQTKSLAEIVTKASTEAVKERFRQS
jgi:phasin family protein